MTTYSVYLPSSLAYTRANLAEKSRVIPDRFSWGGFFVPLLWLLLNRLWLNALVLFAVEMGLAFAASRLGVPPAVSFGVGLILMLMVGLEGRRWLCAALERRGYRLVTIVQAETDDEALHQSLAACHESEAVTYSGPNARTPQSRGVIGLFPGPDERS
ncbi:MAG: DUF2628 domain-containing protein [Hyphomicrobiales bacterium]